MLDLAVSFTASRDLDTAGEEVILNVLTVGIPLCRRYITGGCVGGDAFIGRWLVRNRPEAEHIVVVPWDKGRVSPWYLTEPAVQVIAMPAGTTYKDRNAELVRRGSAVCGFPAYEEEDPRSQRSGTWQTLRMAEAAGKLCRWDCVKSPFTGRIEKPLGEFMREMQDG